MLELISNDSIDLVAALKAEGLPTADLLLDNRRFWRLLGGGGVVGYFGLERYDNAALLRSLVVDRGFIGHGFGRQLVASAIDQAKLGGIETLWLLTKTAEPFFRHLGWHVIDRSEAPLSVAQSPEFTVLCPSNAVCMYLPI